MALVDLLVELSKLDRAEKLRVIQHLAHELEDELDTSNAFTPNSVYEVWSPQDEGNTVATLHKLLQERKQGSDAK